jgi:hypothetical protein
MATTPRLTDRQNPIPSPVTTINGDCQRALHPHKVAPAANPSRRFGRALGFWLGGFLLGVGGCVLGGCMYYRHPVALTINALWWGLYFGSFGASIGALLGMWAERPPDPSSQRELKRRGSFLPVRSRNVRKGLHPLTY